MLTIDVEYHPKIRHGTHKQAEAQAEVMAEAFVSNVESLVTRDYLDVRLDANCPYRC